MEEQKQPTNQNTTERKSNKTIYWVLGGCGCLAIVIIIILLVVFGLNYIKNQETGGTRNNTQKSQSSGNTLSKEEMIDYFVDTAFYDADTGQPQVLNKWTTDKVTVGFNGSPSADAQSTVDQFIENFNSISSATKLRRISGNADISVNWGASTGSSAGSTGYAQNPDKSILAARVDMGDIASTEGAAMYAIFSHEMMHALGFHHYKGTDCRLMSPKTCGYDPYSTNEKRLIEMMYSSGIPVGSGEKAIRSYFANWKSKI